MPRALSDRERALAQAMITLANPTDADDPPPSADKRRRWSDAVRFPSPDELLFITA